MKSVDPCACADGLLDLIDESVIALIDDRVDLSVMKHVVMIWEPLQWEVEDEDGPFSLRTRSKTL